jgi:hypothetical protein
MEVACFLGNRYKEHNIKFKKIMRQSFLNLVIAYKQMFSVCEYDACGLGEDQNRLLRTLRSEWSTLEIITSASIICNHMLHIRLHITPKRLKISRIRAYHGDHNKY